MTEGRRESRLGISIRTMAALVAVAALISLIVRESISLRDYHRRGPASEKLLAPLVKFHRHYRDDYKDRSHNDLVNARNRISEAFQWLSAVVRSTRLAPIGTDKSNPEIFDTNWNKARPGIYNSIREFRLAGHNLQDASWNQRMSAHEGHLEDYYRQLLDNHEIELRPLPAALAAERLGLEAALRRRSRNPNNPKLTLGPEPPPHLLPGAPKPKPDPGFHWGPATTAESSW